MVLTDGSDQQVSQASAIDRLKPILVTIMRYHDLLWRSARVMEEFVDSLVCGSLTRCIK